jgi:hypothetical protein
MHRHRFLQVGLAARLVVSYSVFERNGHRFASRKRVKKEKLSPVLIHQNQALEHPKPTIVLETAVDVQEVRKLDAYLKRVFGNQKIRVVPRPKKDDSAEVYIGEEFIGVLFVDDEDDDRSFQFQMAILEEDLVEQG